MKQLSWDLLVLCKTHLAAKPTFGFSPVGLKSAPLETGQRCSMGGSTEETTNATGIFSTIHHSRKDEKPGTSLIAFLASGLWDCWTALSTSPGYNPTSHCEMKLVSDFFLFLTWHIWWQTNKQSKLTNQSRRIVLKVDICMVCVLLNVTVCDASGKNIQIQKTFPGKHTKKFLDFLKTKMNGRAN